MHGTFWYPSLQWPLLFMHGRGKTALHSLIFYTIYPLRVCWIQLTSGKRWDTPRKHCQSTAVVIQTAICTHNQTYVQFSLAFRVKLHIFGLWEESGGPEETHTGTMKLACIHADSTQKGLHKFIL